MWNVSYSWLAQLGEDVKGEWEEGEAGGKRWREGEKQGLFLSIFWQGCSCSLVILQQLQLHETFAMCCGVLRCVAVGCIVLLCVAVYAVVRPRHVAKVSGAFLSCCSHITEDLCAVLSSCIWCSCNAAEVAALVFSVCRYSLDTAECILKGRLRWQVLARFWQHLQSLL